MAALTQATSTGRGVEIGIGTSDNTGSVVPGYETTEASAMDTTESGNNSNNNNSGSERERRSAEIVEAEGRDTIAVESVWRPY